MVFLGSNIEILLPHPSFALNISEPLASLVQFVPSVSQVFSSPI